MQARAGPTPAWHRPRLQDLSSTYPGLRHFTSSYKQHVLQAPAKSSEWHAAHSSTRNPPARRVCLRFWSSGAPIRVPEDSSTVKLGQMAFTFDSNTAQFVDRHGTAYPVARSAKPPLFAYTATLTWSLIIVTAQLDNNGTVCAFKPVIYVPYT